jgi:hypothetical protein
MVLPPEQKLFVPVTIAVGLALTVTVVVAEVVEHPLELVTVTL